MKLNLYNQVKFSNGVNDTAVTRGYRTKQTTVGCFAFVVSSGDLKYLEKVYTAVSGPANNNILKNSIYFPNYNMKIFTE